MKLPHFLATATALFFTGCAVESDLHRLAEQADQQAYRALQSGRGSGQAVRSSAQVVETFYYTQKYRGNPEQIRLALERGRRATQSARPPERSTTNRQRASPSSSATRATATEARLVEESPTLPRYLAVSVGKNPDTRASQIMLYDTQRHTILDNTVYETTKTPQLGQALRLDKVDAVAVD